MKTKEQLDKLSVDFYIYCETCRKKIGFYKKAMGYGHRVQNGTIMIGQGIGKPQLCFCNKECFKKWEEKHETK